MINKQCLTGLILSLTCLSSVFADTQLISSYSTSTQSTPQSATILLKDGMLALQDANGVTNGFYDSARDVVIAIDHRNKSYYEIDRAFASQMGEQLNSAMTMLNEQMEKAMAGMSEEQKQQFKAMMPEMMSNKTNPTSTNVSIQKTGKTKTVAGINCDLAEIQENQQSTQQLCIASSQAAGISDKEMQSLKKLWQFAGQFTHLIDLVDKEQIQVNPASITAALEQMQGIPLAMDSSDGASGHITTISHDSIANTLFTIPEGFQKKSLMNLMSGIGQQ
ncbi:MAG: DUF4412 domain-containing protein [Methylococcales bacterium]